MVGQHERSFAGRVRVVDESWRSSRYSVRARRYERARSLAGTLPVVDVGLVNQVAQRLPVNAELLRELSDAASRPARWPAVAPGPSGSSSSPEPGCLTESPADPAPIAAQADGLSVRPAGERQRRPRSICDLVSASRRVQNRAIGRGGWPRMTFPELTGSSGRR